MKGVAAKDPLDAKLRGTNLLHEADAAPRISKSERPPENTLADKVAVIRPRENSAVSQLDVDRPSGFSDEALALDFAHYHRDDLRYVAIWGKWLLWSGTQWRADDTLMAFDLVRHVCRDAAARCKTERLSTTIASAKTVAAVERLAKADRRLAATSDQWDADAWALNTPAGLVDLRTGILKPSLPSDYNTRLTTVAPGGSCPIFRDFLNRITGGDKELQKFLQRAFGYALTGSVQEHALLFFYGTGANGKSVLLKTISDILGDYHQQAPIETFTASIHQRHETELAALRGARLVTAVETEEGRRWAEARIKTLTGGDKISARFMRQDYFQFDPQFKLVIAGNHKPGLRTVDEAIRRRFHLVPFAVTIPPAERDPDLTTKLQSEWPGILKWMIEGCLEWQRQGLSPPAVVRDATSAYLDAEDALAAWMGEKCDRDPNAEERSQALFSSWKTWAERSGEYFGNSKTFRNKLETCGVLHKLDRRGRAVYVGLRLRSESDAHPRWGYDEV